MDIVLWRMRIKDGKEERAQEWIAFLQEHQEEGNKTLKNEKEHLEIYFLNQENGAAYAYMFVLADDLDYAAKIAENSGNPLDAKHMEYMSVCVDWEIFLCFIRKNDKNNGSSFFAMVRCLIMCKSYYGD